MSREERLQTAQDTVEDMFPDETVILVVGSKSTGIAVLFSDVAREEAAAVLTLASQSIMKNATN